MEKCAAEENGKNHQLDGTETRFTQRRWTETCWWNWIIFSTHPTSSGRRYMLWALSATKLSASGAEEEIFFYHSTHPLEQRSPTFLAPGRVLWKTIFPWTCAGEVGRGELCSYENLMPDLRWSWDGDANAGEWLQIQMKLHSLSYRSPPAMQPGS